jgi:hypothetical protein
MGGFGSGEKLKKKTTVEECLKLDVGRFSKTVCLVPGINSSGKLTWTNSRGEQILSLHYSLEPKAEDWAMFNLDTLMTTNNNGVVIESIPLQGTIPNFGGMRWWFLCPLVKSGATCNRRVNKLFLLPRGEYFGCRACLNLTYESAQTHDARVNKLMRNPLALIEEIESEDPMRKLRAIRAYGKLRGWMR